MICAAARICWVVSVGGFKGSSATFQSGKKICEDKTKKTAATVEVVARRNGRASVSSRTTEVWTELVNKNRTYCATRNITELTVI